MTFPSSESARAPTKRVVRGGLTDPPLPARHVTISVIPRGHEPGKGHPTLGVPGELVEARTPRREQHHISGKGGLARFVHRRGEVRNQMNLRPRVVFLEELADPGPGLALAYNGAATPEVG